MDNGGQGGGNGWNNNVLGGKKSKILIADVY